MDAPSRVDPDAVERDIAENKDLAALGYAWVVSILVFIAKRHSPFVTFHAKQGMVLFLLSVAFWFVPVGRSFLEMCVFLGALYGFLNAAQGLWTEVPFVGSLARGKLQLRASWRELVAAVVRIKSGVLRAWTKHDAVHRRYADTGRDGGERRDEPWHTGDSALSSSR